MSESGQAADAGQAPRALVVDDEADLRELFELTLIGMGLDVDCAADLAQARSLLAGRSYAFCLTDIRLPDGSGLELIDLIHRAHPDTPVAAITAFGSTENAIAALKAGAFDYLGKPLSLEALRGLVRTALRLSAPAPEPAAASRGAAVAAGNELIGDSQAIRDVRETIARLARSTAPVAIAGESGSGKELAARMIHRLGPRADKPFVAVNCGAIPEALMESEFFGHRKGSFTGADRENEGFFRAADGGTLFLDEVADLPLTMQVKLLRAIQEKRVRKVGATTEDPVDVRIVSATHQDLARCVAAGRFRQDLYYRLDVIGLRMPALRDRPEDIGPLSQALLERLARRAGLPVVPRISSVTLKYLQSYAFPGNVRELENILERALAFSSGDVINIEDLGLRPAVTEEAGNERAAAADAPGRDAGAPVAERDAQAGDAIPASLPDYLDRIEREAIERALEKTHYNRTAAARLLGITFRALRYRMQRLDIN